MQAEIKSCEMLLRTLNEVMKDGTLDNGKVEKAVTEKEKRYGVERWKTDLHTTSAHTCATPSGHLLWFNGATAQSRCVRLELPRMEKEEIRERAVAWIERVKGNYVGTHGE